MLKSIDVQNVVYKTSHWFLLERVQASLERFKAGLCVLGVLDAMCLHSEQFKNVFCHSAVTLDAEKFGALFCVKRSEEGSNQFRIESLVLSHWSDFLQDIEENVIVGLSFSDILFFSSGCKAIPPLGLSLKLHFLHEAEEDGCQSRFPKANACACILHLPVVHKTCTSFKDDLVFGVLNTKGFGYA